MTGSRWLGLAHWQALLPRGDWQAAEYARVVGKEALERQWHGDGKRLRRILQKLGAPA